MTPKRTFLITGGTKGIGLATTKRLVDAGHTVVTLARHDPGEEFPGTFYPVDLADTKSTERVLREIVMEHAIDGLVNNVGIVKHSPAGEMRVEVLEEVLNLNMRPAVQVTEAVLPNMRKNQWGRIINISSLVVVGAPRRAFYAAAKAGMISFTRSWALDLADDNILVNTVAPGPIGTELFRQNNPPGSEGEQRYIRLVPLSRVGKPEEVAAAIAFLLSDEASYITGQTLFVDGGASIGSLAR